MEAWGVRGEEVLAGSGHGDGEGLGAGTSSQQGQAERGRMVNPLDARGRAGRRGFALGAPWAWAHGGGERQAGAGGWCHGGGGCGE